MININKTYIFSLLTLSLLVFLSCNSTNSNDNKLSSSIEGIWKSKKVTPVEDELIMTLDLNQDGTQISGTVIINFTNYPDEAPDKFSIESGTYDPPSLNIIAKTDATNKNEESLTCVVQDEKTMQCDEPSENWTNKITLKKQ